MRITTSHGGGDWRDNRVGPIPQARRRAYIGRVIRISVSVAAFEALTATLPLGTVGYESEPCPKGERWIWLEEAWANKLAAVRMPGESYSDAILWLVELEAAGRAG